jgi:ubiquinone/menaquinone biosynthesis C-methylase UbiE
MLLCCCMTYHAGAQLIDPHLLYQKAGMFPGAHVAVFGAGRTGHIVFPASVVVGPHGSVYAVDILKDVLAEIDKRARLENLHNIHTVWSDVEQTGKTHIPESHIDMLFLVNVLCKVSAREAVFAEAARVMADKARMVVVDWNERSTLPFAPPAEKRVGMKDVVLWGEHAGFVLQEFFEAGAHHNGVVLYRAG